MTFDIPPVTQLDGYAGISMSVCLSVCPACPEQIFGTLNFFVAKRGTECHAK